MIHMACSTAKATITDLEGVIVFLVEHQVEER